MSKQQERQNAVRLLTSTAYNYADDWHALFDGDGIAEGPFNERMRNWINATLGTSYLNVNDAMRAFAVDQGFTRWSEMGDFILGARITLSNDTLAEDSATGTLVGTLAVVNGSGGYTFSITADPDNKFAIDGVDNTRLEIDNTLDFETATTHSVTISAAGSGGPYTRTFTIYVTDVTELPPSGPTGNGILLEDGSSFLLAENSDYLILEQ